MKTVKISDYGKSTNGAVWWFTQGKLQEMLNEQAKLTRRETDIEWSKQFGVESLKPNHKGIECVCEFKPISYGPVFVFENEYETVLLSDTGTQFVFKDKHSSAIYSAFRSLAERIGYYQRIGYKQIG